MSSAASRSPDERGQAAVELALSLPLVALVLAAVVQVGLVVRDQVLVVHAAREVARELAVDDKAEEPGHIAQTATGGALAQGRLTVEVSEQGGRIRARVGYRAPIRVPLVRKLVPDVQIAANAEVRSEVD
jgi:TadE-like protein